MKTNEGNLDRVVRVIIGLLFLGSVYMYSLPTWLMVIISVLGVMLIITGVVGYCGIYSFLGISTCPVTIKKMK